MGPQLSLCNNINVTSCCVFVQTLIPDFYLCFTILRSMTTNIELKDLSQRKSGSAAGAEAAYSTPGPDITNVDERDQSVTAWAYGATAL